MHPPVLECVGLVKQDWCQVQAIQGSVIRRADASQSQTGGEQVHHIGQLEAHLQKAKESTKHNRRVRFEKTKELSMNKTQIDPPTQFNDSAKMYLSCSNLTSTNCS